MLLLGTQTVCALRRDSCYRWVKDEIDKVEDALRVKADKADLDKVEDDVLDARCASAMLHGCSRAYRSSFDAQ